MKNLILSLCMMAMAANAHAQELQAKITINHNQI